MTVLTQRTASPRSTRTSASGSSPYRALLVGLDAPLLAEGIAEGLAARTGHGVDVEAVPTTPLAAEHGTLLPGRDLSRVDAVVLVLDPQHGQPAHELRGGVRAVLDDLAGRITVGSALTVVVPAPRSSTLTARELEAATAAVRDAADALTPVVPLADLPGATEDERIARWADAIATAAASGLIDPMVAFVPDDHFDEDERLDAVDRLPPRDGLWVAQFQQIVDEARAAYGTSCAALTIIDADFTRYGVTTGLDNTKVLRRGQSICNRVLRTYGGLIVGDAQQDPRFQRNPEVRAGDVRFYAGYRVESQDGAPLGSLCVFDPTPRDEVGEQDLIRLRDLATTAQRRIWALERAAS